MIELCRRINAQGPRRCWRCRRWIDLGPLDDRTALKHFHITPDAVSCTSVECLLPAIKKSLKHD